MRTLKHLFCGVALLLATLTARAQWVSQSVQLNPGWNAVCFWLDPEPADLDTIFTNTAILHVWQWDRRFTSVQFTSDMNNRLAESPHWQYWYPEWSGLAFLSTIDELMGGEAYLIEVRSNAAPFTLTLKGRPVLPLPQWMPNALNFVGFPATPSPGPYFLDYFRGASEVDIYASYNPPLYTVNSAGAGVAVNAPGRQRMHRGAAYWRRLKGGKGYVAPFTIEGLGNGLLDFGSAVEELTFTIANSLTSTAVSVTLSPAVSESPPAGQPAIAGAVPLSWYNVVSLTNRNWVTFTNAFTVTVPARGKTTVRFGIRRTDMEPAPTGAVYQSLINIQDTAGRVFYQLPVRAEPPQLLGLGLPIHNPFEGLWVGEAQINWVNHPILTTNGWDYLTLSETRERFPVRLLLHVDSNGVTRLLQRVVVVPNPRALTNQPDFILYADDRQVPAGVTNATRLSTAMFHKIAPLVMDGDFFGALEGTLTLDYNDPRNPFKHLYHPDHNNLASDYATPLPEGVESWTITRAIRMEFTSITNYPNEPMWGSDAAGGLYIETLTNLREQPVIAAGYFGLERVNRISGLKQ